MCFSATASFTAGCALSAMGGVTIAKVRRKSEILFAAIPLLFGVQQLTEGVIWLSFQHPILLSVMTSIYLFFSNVLWPTWIPLSILLIERKPWRRNILRVFFAIGIVVSLYYAYFLCTETVKAEIVNLCISYVAPHFSAIPMFSAYTIATCASCYISSHRFINLFGVVTLLSALVAFQFYEHAFISVWCFFAAILSVIIFLHFHFANQHSLKKG